MLLDKGHFCLWIVLDWDCSGTVLHLGWCWIPRFWGWGVAESDGTVWKGNAGSGVVLHQRWCWILYGAGFKVFLY